MAKPIVEQIAENLLTTINAITTANGFNQTLTATRPKRMWKGGEDGPVNLDVDIIQDNWSIVGEVSMITTIEQEFTIQVHLSPSESDSVLIDTLRNQVEADITKKLMEDHTRGDLAIETKITGGGPWADDPTDCGTSVLVEVQYRIVTGDPYTQA